MNHYHWTEKLKTIYDRALADYRTGRQSPGSLLSEEDAAELSSIGLLPVNVFDYVEDFAKYGQPSWEDFLLVASARRDYYLYILHCDRPAPAISESDLPAKTEAFDGIEWLPRIALKARCFLEGTLPNSIMYGCGGDRRFLQSHDIHLGDFLRITWSAKGDIARIRKFLRA